MTRSVLIVEDDPDIARLIQLQLRDIDCRGDIVGDGKRALTQAQARDYDLLILDLMLPGLDGLSVCREIRSRDRLLPILMLTSKSSEVDRVVGLEMGADDYLTKPFSILELNARVKALLRRAEAAKNPTPGGNEEIIELKDLTIDIARHRVVVDGTAVELTAKRRLSAHGQFAHQSPARQDRARSAQPHPRSHRVGRRLPVSRGDGVSWHQTLYAKLALGLALLLVLIGLLYAGLSQSLSVQHAQSGNQQLNRELAQKLVQEMGLVEGGRVNQTKIKEAFNLFMLVNPNIELYLLDRDGRILAFSADPNKVKRTHVDVAPIERFLAGESMYPLLGEDPRSASRSKVFSATPVPDASNPSGYLYVVLQGEEADAIAMAEQARYLRQLGIWAVSGALVIGLAVGLVVFYLLTRRLRRLNRQLNQFESSGFRRLEEDGEGDAGRDEIGQLARHFAALSERITVQLEQLEQQDKLRRELVANVSHDLRTPLAALHGYLEMLSHKGEQLTPAETKEFLNTALRHSQRLGRLVADLFELSKLDAREVEPAIEPFSMAELVQDVTQKHALNAQKAGIELSVDAPANLPYVAGDIGLLERALDNLVDNAMSHTQPGGKVTITLHPGDQRVEVAVQDTGRGIPPDQLALIFQRFHQVDNEHRGGTHAGLGLAITKRIIELHSQRIEVASKVGEGTCFSFSLAAA
jgi:signal transduction histidine kinase/DNA-binding response OmpR family regulator